MLLVLLQIFTLSSVCVADICRTANDGELYVSAYGPFSHCWNILVAKERYVFLGLESMKLTGSQNCTNSEVLISMTDVGTEMKVCPVDKNLIPVNTVSDVKITYTYSATHYVTFTMNYRIERRTSIPSINGVNASRENSISWLKRQQSASFGWGRNTHRAITALYLTGNASFHGYNLEEELFANKLELQTLVALLRNSSDPLTVNDLSMFINALTVTCHNPRQFHGYDLLQILSEQVAASNTPIPGAYLTLCNCNWTIPESYVRILLNGLYKQSENPFRFDNQAMTVMALTCIKNKKNGFDNNHNATELYNDTIQQFIAGQLPDGSFGNVFTTALVTQALLSSGQENNANWNLVSTVNFLMQKLHTSGDFLSNYLTLPILNNSSLVDIANVKCTTHRKHGEDDDITDIKDKLGGKILIQYSLYIGNQKDMIFTMYQMMSDNSSVYDVMRMAVVSDPKWKFLYSDQPGHVYVYEIAGMINDPEAGKYWFLYTGNSFMNETVTRQTESIDKIIVKNGDHFIMWYRTVHM